MITLQEKRVLAIDPTGRGFGFAVLEGPRKLIDWGVKQIRKEKTARSILQSKELMEHYYPDVIVVEDWKGRGSRRCLRIGNLIRAIRMMAEGRRIPTRCFSRYRVRQAFYSWHRRVKKLEIWRHKAYASLGTKNEAQSPPTEWSGRSLLGMTGRSNSLSYQSRHGVHSRESLE
jgi:hypothetical protein